MSKRISYWHRAVLQSLSPNPRIGVHHYYGGDVFYYVADVASSQPTRTSRFRVRIAGHTRCPGVPHRAGAPRDPSCHTVYSLHKFPVPDSSTVHQVDTPSQRQWTHKRTSTITMHPSASPKHTQEQKCMI